MRGTTRVAVVTSPRGRSYALGGLGAADASCLTDANAVWAGGDCTRLACSNMQKGAKGACDRYGIPWGGPLTSSPPASSGATTASAGGAFFGSGAGSSAGSTFGSNAPGVFTPASPPEPIATDPDPSDPEPTAEAPAACSTNWDTATAEINGILSSVGYPGCSKQSLPAELPDCSTGTGSRASYLAARAKYLETVEASSVLCAGQTNQNANRNPYDVNQYSGGSSYGSSYGRSPYSTAPVQTQNSTADIPVILPDNRPFVSRKVGLGVGGLLLLGGGIFLLTRKSRGRRGLSRS